jgi:hypothetical protein
MSGHVLLPRLYAFMACTQVPNLIAISLVVLEMENYGDPNGMEGGLK